MSFLNNTKRLVFEIEYYYVYYVVRNKVIYTYIICMA